MSEPGVEVVRREGPPRPTRRFGRSRQFLLGVIVLLMVGIAVKIGFPSAYAWLKASRGRQAASTAEKLASEDRFEEAARYSRVAFELAPAEPEVLRMVARLGARMGRPDSVSYFAAYRATGRMTREDRIAMAEAAVRFGRVDLARPVLAELMQESPGDRHVWRLTLAHARQSGDVGQAISLARNLAAKFVGDPEAEFDLAVLLMAGGKPAQVGEARRILWGLALGRTALDQQAATVLAQQPDLKPAEAETLARVLESAKTNALPRALLGLHLRMRANPARKDEFLQKASALVPTNGPVGEVCELVLWLTDRGGLTYASAHLPADRCRTNLLLLAARLDYLVGVDDSAGLEATVADKDNVLDAGMRSAAKGALAAKQGRKEEAERLFRAALDSSASRVILVAPFVAREAERYRMNALAVQALQRWMEAPGMGMQAARRILRLLQEDPDPAQALTTLRRLHAKVPGEEGVVAERAWHELLAGENLEWALTELRRLSALRPEDATLRYTLALAEWRSGKAAEALSLVEAQAVELDDLSLRQRVIYAVILGANNQREAARRVARTVPSRPGFGYEALLQPWR